MPQPQTLFEKIWRQHLVAALTENDALIYIDRIFLHERTGSIALETLAADARKVRNPELTFCTMDHIVDTFPGRGDQTKMPGGEAFIKSTRIATQKANIKLFDITDPQQGIVHVISPELGIVLPGVTLVCPDSHTCTQGALGALAWGIGSSDAEHALATQTLRVSKPNTMRVSFNGILKPGVTSKDMILYLIAKHSASGGLGCVVEFAGAAVRQLSVEARMTLCNMAVEFSAFTGIIAPDDVVFDYLAGKAYAPTGDIWNQALVAWRTLYSDDDAVFDHDITIDCADIPPMVTWGTSPQHAVAIDGCVPALEELAGTNSAPSSARVLTYMDLQPGQRLSETKIDAAFIGSCTNSRLSDLRAAAGILKGNKVAAGVKAICVPGSTQVKRAAEAEGLDTIFKEAGFEWRESGCSMCFFAGGESFGFQQRVISTTNRNFESRQGPETRTHLASPITVAASAIAGYLADPRRWVTS